MIMNLTVLTEALTDHSERSYGLYAIWFLICLNFVQRYCSLLAKWPEWGFDNNKKLSNENNSVIDRLPQEIITT